jgi:hypothetical protein
MKTPLLAALLAALLLAAPAHAQTPANADEIAFWETVRDSRNPAELQAYIDTYPKGKFVVLAKARLAALQKPAAQPSAPVVSPKAAGPAIAAPARAPGGPVQAGDSWTYRLSFPRQWGDIRRSDVHTHVVTVRAATGTEIVDQVSVDSGIPTEVRHGGGSYLATQGVSVFSPYLVTLQTVTPGTSLGRVKILDQPCQATYVCSASARVIGSQAIVTKAGTFDAIKVQVEQSWRAGSTGSSPMNSGQMSGGRILTIYYAPAVKRAVKFESRWRAGDVPPVDPTFDLELISYQVK